MRFFFYLGSISIFFICSCKVNYQQVNDELKVKEAYIQEEVPGQQREKPKTYFKIQFLEEYASEVVIDSIVLINTMQPTLITPAINGLTLKTTLTQNIGKPVQAIGAIYFKRGKNRYRQMIQPIDIKAALYLP